MYGEKRMHVLSLASFSFSFLPSFLFSFLPFLFFFFSCSSGWPQTVTFQPLSARITGFPTILKFSGIVFLTTLVTLTGVSMSGYRAHAMIQGRFSRVGSLFPACGRTQGSNSECPAWGKPLSPLTHPDVIILSLFFTFITQVDFHQQQNLPTATYRTVYCSTVRTQTTQEDETKTNTQKRFLFLEIINSNQRLGFRKSLTVLNGSINRHICGKYLKMYLET